MFFFQNPLEYNAIYVRYRVREYSEHNTFRPKSLMISAEVKNFLHPIMQEKTFSYNVGKQIPSSRMTAIYQRSHKYSF